MATAHDGNQWTRQHDRCRLLLNRVGPAVVLAMVLGIVWNSHLAWSAEPQHREESGMVNSASDTPSAPLLPGPCRTETPSGGWETVGPLGSTTDALAVDPQSWPSILYAGCSWGGGIYKSSFDGTAWRYAGDGLKDDHVTEILADFSQANRVFASTLYGGVYRSLDGALTWTCITCDPDPFLYCRGLLMDPLNPAHLIAYGKKGTAEKVQCGGVWGSLSGGGYVESFNSGDSWTYHDIEAGAQIWAMAMDPKHPTLMYAVLREGPHNFARTITGGTVWTTFTTYNNSLADVERMVVSPAYGEIFLGRTPPLRSTDGGLTWEKAFGGFCCTKGIAFASPDLLWAGGINLYHSDDGGYTFSQDGQWIHNPPYPPDNYHADIRSVAIDPPTWEVRNTYFGTDGGLVKLIYTDTGYTFDWQELGKPAYMYRVAVDPGNIGHYICSMQDFPGAYTTDAGLNWGYTTLPEAGKFLFHPGAPQNVYWSSGRQVFKSTDGGVNYANMSTGIPDVQPGTHQAFDLNPNNGNALVVGTGEGPYYSYDGAHHWQKSGGITLQNGEMVMDVVASHYSDFFYLLVVDQFITKSKIYRSVNNGLTWDLRGSDLPPMQRLAVDPFDVFKLYGTAWQNCGQDGLYFSDNGGTSFEYRSGPPIGPVIQGGFDHSLAIHPDVNKAGHLWMATAKGLAQSFDYGMHWSSYSLGLRASLVTDLIQRPDNPTRLLASTYGHGLVTRTFSSYVIFTVDLIVSIIHGIKPLHVTLSASTQGGVGPFAYRWDFGDGEVVTSAVPTVDHTYTLEGRFFPQLTVSDLGAAEESVTWTHPELITVLPELEVLASATPASGSPPLQVAFSATASGGTPPYTLDWDFGDGSGHGSGNVITHTYSSPNAYHWTLSVTDSMGKTGSAHGTVAATGECSLHCIASAPASAPAGADLGFSVNAAATRCLGTPAITWNFGDGSTAEGAAATHLYSTPGNYLWTVSASADGVECQQAGTVNISDLLTCRVELSAGATPQQGQAPLSVSFSALGTLQGCTTQAQYSWTFGDGATSTEQNPVHLYTEAGDFAWRVTVTSDESASSAGGTIVVSEPCTLVCTASVPTVASAGLPASLQAAATPSHCSGSPLFDWDFGDGSAHSIEQNPSHTYAAPETYNWTLSVKAESATCTKTGTITVVAPPLVASIAKAGNPFRLKVYGSNFQQGMEVFLGTQTSAWSSLSYKNDSKVVIKKGSALKALFPKGVPVAIRLLNPDGGEAFSSYIRP